MGFWKLVSFVWANMQHLARIIGLLLAIGCQQVQPLQEDGYPYVSKHNENRQTSRRRLAQHDYDGHAYSQQQNAPYGRPQLVQMPAFHNQALYGYDSTPTNTQPLSAHPTQHWSGAPIVVDYGGDYLEQEQRTPPQSNYALPPAALQPTTAVAQNPFLSAAAAADLQSQTPQRFSFDLNNGNNYNSRDLAGHLNRQPVQQQHQQQQLPTHYQHQPGLSLPARYQLQQLPPYYQQQQQQLSSLPNALPTRNNAAKYAAHFASYVRKYPYRLQPIFQPNDYKKR